MDMIRAQGKYIEIIGGTGQAVGIVSDVGLFLRALAMELGLEFR